MHGTAEEQFAAITATARADALREIDNISSDDESVDYRSGTVNSKSFVGQVLLRIKRKFELTYAL